MKYIDLPFCKCGCGERVTRSENKFLNYHYIRYKNPMKDKKVSEKVKAKNIGRCKTKEELEKIKESCKGINKGKKNGMYGVKGNNHPCFGIPKTEEHKEKLRKKALQNNYSGQNNPMFGKKHRKETIKKQSEIKKGITWEDRMGKKAADKRREILSEKMSGVRHPNWRGGCTDEGYCEEWRTKELKEHILERDNYICQNLQCDNKLNKLCIHHINYNKKDCDPWNLITTCVSCNSVANYNRGWWTSYYQEIIRRKNIYKEK